MTSTGEEVFFKIKRSTKLTKLQGAYAAKVGKDVGSIRLVTFSFFSFVFLGGVSLLVVTRYLCTRETFFFLFFFFIFMLSF